VLRVGKGKGGANGGCVKYRVRTDIYILKRKLMLMIHNIRIKET
jgi:hypothetical protein